MAQLRRKPVESECILSFGGEGSTPLPFVLAQRRKERQGKQELHCLHFLGAFARNSSYRRAFVMEVLDIEQAASFLSRDARL